MNKISEIIRELSDFAWGPYMIIFLVGIGLYLTFITGFIQLKGFAYAFRILFKKNKDNFAGEITPFQALCTALSGAIGIGNIVGVATAIAAGGPGAIVHLEIVWNFSDVTNGLMAIPNLIALLGLSKVVAKETNNYFSSKN